MLFSTNMLIGLFCNTLLNLDDKIHATIKKHLIMKFEPVLQEGSVYIISNFGVPENTTRFKMVRHPYRFNFYRITMVKTYGSWFCGSRYGLEFKHFDDILVGTLESDHAFGKSTLCCSV